MTKFEQLVNTVKLEHGHLHPYAIIAYMKEAYNLAMETAAEVAETKSGIAQSILDLKIK